MNFWLEWIVGTLAAIGGVCILKALYGIILAEYLTSEVEALLVLRGAGDDPCNLRLMRAVLRLRRSYLPKLQIVFEESRPKQERENPFAELDTAGVIQYFQ